MVFQLRLLPATNFWTVNDLTCWHLDPWIRFLSFDEQPVAAASIAQVHRAILKDHQEVAVKVNP